MEAIIKENLKKMRYVVRVNITGLMASSMKENGRKTRCMEMALLDGKMEKFTRVSL